MSTILPQGELLRKAFAYLAEERAQNPQKNLTLLLDEAAMRFNLTPLDAMALERLFKSDNANKNKVL